MRKILLSAICLIATIVSAGKTSVMAKSDNFVNINDATKGFFTLGYSADFGYGANTGYSVDAETNSVTASATAGLYSSFDIVAMLNLYGLFELNVKLATVPLAVNPISTSASWTHPIALSQGEEMTGIINAGYSFTIGDVQVYYYINNLFPKVSLLDYITGDSNFLIPGDITTSSASNVAPPNGFDWNVDRVAAVYNADPFLNFNLGDWISENTDIMLITSGDFIEPIDLFAEYNETK
jgi:hypothetical protein